MNFLRFCDDPEITCCKAAAKIDHFERIAADIPLDRLEAICDAKRDGRCVVLPCKTKDEVWVVKNGEIHRNYAVQWHLITNSPNQCFLSLYDDYCGMTDFGKTVFLTRAEAEAALAGQEDKP